MVMMVLMVAKMMMVYLASTLLMLTMIMLMLTMMMLMLTMMVMTYLASTLLTASLLRSRPAQSWESSALFTCHVVRMISGQSEDGQDENGNKRNYYNHAPLKIYPLPC